MTYFLYLQKLFKLAIASMLLFLNVLGIGWSISIAKSAIICSTLMQSIPEAVTKPLQINASWFLQAIANLLIMLVFKATQGILTLISLLWPHTGILKINPPTLISLPALQIPTGITPVELIPFLKDPQNILALCDYTNITTGVFLSAGITAIIFSLGTFILTNNLPMRFAKWINQYRANQIIKLAKKLEKAAEKIEYRELPYDDKRDLIERIKDFFKK